MKKQYRRFALALAVSISMTFVAFTMGFKRMPSTLTDARRRFKKYTRRGALVNWERRLEWSLSQPKFGLKEENHHDAIHVHVISLPRSSERRSACLSALKEQNVSHTLTYAVDGLLELQPGEVARYTGRKKGASLRHSSRWSQEKLLELRKEYESGTLSDDARSHLHERLRFGCTMSHVRLWLKLLSSDERFFVIIEDDANVVPDFVIKMRRALRQLPKDWDLFYMNACDIRLGGNISETIRQFRGGSCTLGYAISRKGAEHLVYRRAPGSNLPVDKMMNIDIELGRIYAFYTDPPLVFRLVDHASTLAY